MCLQVAAAKGYYPGQVVGAGPDLFAEEPAGSEGFSPLQVAQEYLTEIALYTGGRSLQLRCTGGGLSPACARAACLGRQRRCLHAPGPATLAATLQTSWSAEHDDTQGQAGKVQLMTMHAVKGLEFEVSKASSLPAGYSRPAMRIAWARPAFDSFFCLPSTAA